MSHLYLINICNMAENKEKLPEDIPQKEYSKSVLEKIYEKLKEWYKKADQNFKDRIASEEALGMLPGKMSFKKDSRLRNGGKVK